jgi:hypothetical protein
MFRRLATEATSAGLMPSKALHVQVLTWRRGGEHILDFSQTPNREPNDMNHTESEFVFQTGDDLEIRVREPNGCGFELVLPRHCFFPQPR